MGVCDVPVFSSVCNAVGEGAASLVAAPFDWLAQAMGAAAGWLFEAVWSVFDTTVQAWMGHASIPTTNLYLHHLGTSADLAGLGRLNAAGHTGGTRTGMSGDVRGSRSDDRPDYPCQSCNRVVELRGFEPLSELRGLPDQLDHIEAHAGAQLHQRFNGQGVVTIQSPVDR